MKNLKSIEVRVTQKNKKKPIDLVIRRKDFLKIEDNRLYLKDDDRVLYIDHEERKSLIHQYNLYF